MNGVRYSRDSVQYIEHERKMRRDEINTGCCWNKFSEFKSLESSDSVQRIEGCQEDPGRTRKTTGEPDEACGRYRSSSVHPDRFPPESSLVVRIFSQVLVDTGLAQSRLLIKQSFPHIILLVNPSPCS